MKDNFSIEYVAKAEFHSLTEEWNSLECGKEMTFFQSFGWNEMIAMHCIPEDTFFYESRYVVVRAEGKAILIAPLFIIKHDYMLINKKGIYFIDDRGWTDYLNCIYNKFIPEAFIYMLSHVSNKYNINLFNFCQLKESTTSYQFIVNNYQVKDDDKYSCVSLSIPSESEEYIKLLSKNARQNIRTANNRIAKDGLSLSCVFDDLYVDKIKCIEIRQAKLSLQYSKVSKLRKYKYRIMDKLRINYGKCIPILDFEMSKVMTAYINHEIGAFFNYVIDKNTNSVVIISAGTNMKYARYSPGILLMFNYINQIISKHERYCVIDFTRGVEKYKFTLGGSTTSNHNILFVC